MKYNFPSIFHTYFIMFSKRAAKMGGDENNPIDPNDQCLLGCLWRGGGHATGNRDFA